MRREDRIETEQRKANKRTTMKKREQRAYCLFVFGVVICIYINTDPRPIMTVHNFQICCSQQLFLSQMEPHHRCMSFSSPMEPHHHCMSWVLPKWIGSWFLMRIMESPINTTVKKSFQRGVLEWVLILDELWLTEVTLLKCGYWVKASNIWNRVRERYWKKFVEENWEKGEIKKIKCEGNVAKKKRKKKEKKKKQKKKKRVLCWLEDKR